MSVIVASIITNINPVKQPRDSNPERHTQTTFVLELQAAPIYRNYHPRIMSSPRASSPVNSPAAMQNSGRPSSPTPPGGPKTAIRRRAAADQKDKVANVRPSSTRAAGAGGSSSTMLKLYTDESPGLKVDPVVVLVLSIVFIFSVVALHVIAKITRRFSS
ncbi:hypothetical protein V490_04416 [Pseudogymnoascus sp. VKM F-3557]|nr:hypothetical protein V490_04416 [Pseudogymnoascus sp. VKM F-3557]